MKLAIIVFALVMSAMPSAAEAVELVCNGKLTRPNEISEGTPIDGMHLLVGDKTVVVSGGNHLDPTTYKIDRVESDSASLVFETERWFGILNRYSGKLTMLPEPQPNGTGFKGALEATCGKAEPLF